MKKPTEYSGPERRLVDPDRNRLPLAVHAARALHRFVGPSAENLDTAKLGGGSFGGQEYTGQDMREALQSLLYNLDVNIPLEVVAFLGSLETQYRNSLETLKFADVLQQDGRPREGDVAVPAFERVRKTFSFDELRLAMQFESPTLLLMPDELSFPDLVHAIDAHKTLPGQQDVYSDRAFVVDVMPEKKGDTPKITGYSVTIIEGATNMSVKEGDDVEATLGERVEARKAKRQQTPFLKGMDRRKAAWLMLDAYRKQERLDGITFTMLDDDPALSSSRVPCAFLNDWGGKCRPCFGVGGASGRVGGGRFRSSVGGDVLLT